MPQVRKCAVEPCPQNNPDIPKEKVLLFKFPLHDIQTFENLKKFCRVTDDDRKTFYICARHFRPESISTTRLKKGAFPEYYFGYQRVSPVRVNNSKQKKKIDIPVNKSNSKTVILDETCIVDNCKKSKRNDPTIDFIKFSNKSSKILMDLREKLKISEHLKDDKLIICESHLSDFINYSKEMKENVSQIKEQNIFNIKQDDKRKIQIAGIIYKRKYLKLFNRLKKSQRSLRLYRNLRKGIIKKNPKKKKSNHRQNQLHNISNDNKNFQRELLLNSKI